VSFQLRYKDSELFLMKFRQCMTRGLTLVKMYFIDTLQVTVTEISQKIQSEKVSFFLHGSPLLFLRTTSSMLLLPDHRGLERGL